MDYKRKPSDDEKRLLLFLINKANLLVSNLDGLLVEDMNDEGMGSLRLFPMEKLNEDRVFGKAISETEFTDKDGVIVIATLYLDNNNELFELDIWKTNFKRLIAIPNNFE